MVTQIPNMRFALGRYAPAVDLARSEMARDEIVARIWAHDHTVWQPEPTEIANRLGWLYEPQRMLGELPRLRALVEAVRRDGVERALLLGMGGSSLSAEMFSRVFAGGAEGLPGGLDVLDSTDPGAVLAYADRLEPARTLFIVSTKSGTTVEVTSFWRFFHNWALDALGSERVGSHFIAITDSGSPLIDHAARAGFREVALANPNIGGRYSAFAHFGMIPAALVGVDVERLLHRAIEAAALCGPGADTHANPGAALGCALGELARAGRDKVTFVVSEPLASFGDWAEQLIAESTGKQGRGIVPVVGEPLGEPGVYGDDRLFVHARLAGDDAHEQPLARLAAAGHPVIRLELSDTYDLGAQLFLWEFAVAVAGYRLGISPFDQPNVESAKARARELSNRYAADGGLPAGDAVQPSGEALAQFLAQARPGDYIAIQAFVQPTDETDAALAALRVKLRERTRLAVTVGYGPRYLHSTGQLHKGDAGRGLFIQLTAADRRDALIPEQIGRPEAQLSFGVLKSVQALGDLQALRDAGRRAIQFHLGDDPLAGLEELRAAAVAA
ncbi:MAG: glucose-6-phosphate isomerase [Anaerolineales bacterium]|nr:glucose-6-phosphate isomerase [Anaerolineales bacterium]